MRRTKVVAALGAHASRMPTPSEPPEGPRPDRRAPSTRRVAEVAVGTMRNDRMDMFAPQERRRAGSLDPNPPSRITPSKCADWPASDGRRACAVRSSRQRLSQIETSGWLPLRHKAAARYSANLGSPLCGPQTPARRSRFQIVSRTAQTAHGDELPTQHKPRPGQASRPWAVQGSNLRPPACTASSGFAGGCG